MRRLSLAQVIHEISARQGPRTGSFEFDDNQILKISKNIVKLVTGRLENNIPIKYENSVMIKSPITGEPKEIKISLEQVLNQKEFSSGSRAAWNNAGQEIIIYIPDSFIWFAHDSDFWINEIKTNFKHELTHAFDIAGNRAIERGQFPGAGMTATQAKRFFSSKEGRQKYFQDPAEIKAFLSQITHEMQELINKFNFTKPEELLDATYSWPVISKYYINNPKIMKMFLTAAFHVWKNKQDQY